MQNKTKSVNKEKKKQVDFYLIIIILILLAFGIVMVLSASAPSALAETGNSYTYFISQLQYAVLGLIVMWLASRLDYNFYKRLYKVIYVFSVLILFLVLIPGIGASGGGATRWVDFGFVSFQPSEFTKIGLIIGLAGYLTEHKDELKSFTKGFLAPLAMAGVPILIAFFIQNHLSVGIVMGLITVIMMLVAGTRLLHFIIAGSVAIGVGGSALGIYLSTAGEAASEASFRISRILNFFNPWEDATGVGWQTIQGLYAIGSGGIFGVGLGESKQKYLYVSEPQNDFIFAILAEELGFVGCIAVIILFALFVLRGINIAMSSKDIFGSLLATGITALVMVQVVLNIAVVTNSIPNTGMSLPFFSAGGTALILLLGMCGILLNISKNREKV